MGNLGGEFRAIVQLEGGRDSKAGTDLAEEEVGLCLSPFVVVGDRLYPTCEGVHPSQEVPNTFDCEHVGKVKLSVGSRERTSGLVRRKRGAAVTEVGICHLTDFYNRQ